MIKMKETCNQKMKKKIFILNFSVESHKNLIYIHMKLTFAFFVYQD
jgi:hypothetical protein